MDKSMSKLIKMIQKPPSQGMLSSHALPRKQPSLNASASDRLRRLIFMATHQPGK